MLGTPSTASTSRPPRKVTPSLASPHPMCVPPGWRTKGSPRGTRRTPRIRERQRQRAQATRAHPPCTRRRTQLRTLRCHSQQDTQVHRRPTRSQVPTRRMHRMRMAPQITRRRRRHPTHQRRLTTRAGQLPSHVPRLQPVEVHHDPDRGPRQMVRADDRSATDTHTVRVVIYLGATWETGNRAAKA